MGNKNCFDFLHGNTQTFHPLFDLAAVNTCINENSFIGVSDIVAISIAP